MSYFTNWKKYPDAASIAFPFSQSRSASRQNETDELKSRLRAGIPFECKQNEQMHIGVRDLHVLT